MGRVGAYKFEFLHQQVVHAATGWAVASERVDVGQVLEGLDTVFFGENLGSALLFGLVLGLLIDGLVTGSHDSDIVLIINVTLELLLNKEEPLDCYLDFRLVLGTTSPELLEVIS